jgi:hypothetical protein
MGVTKRLMEHYENQRDVAIRIAIQAGVLKRCEIHSDCVFGGGSDSQGAYKLGNSKFTAGELEGIFDERTEMTDCIKKAIEEHHAIDECPRCAKMLAD